MFFDALWEPILGSVLQEPSPPESPGFFQVLMALIGFFLILLLAAVMWVVMLETEWGAFVLFLGMVLSVSAVVLIGLGFFAYHAYQYISGGIVPESPCSLLDVFELDADPLCEHTMSKVWSSALAIVVLVVVYFTSSLRKGVIFGIILFNSLSAVVLLFFAWRSEGASILGPYFVWLLLMGPTLLVLIYALPWGRMGEVFAAAVGVLSIMAVREYSKNLYLMGAILLTVWLFTSIKEMLSITDPGD